MVRSRHDFSRGGTLRSPPPGTYNHLLRLGLVDRTAYDVSVRALNDEGRAYSLDLVVWTGNPPTVVPPDWGLIPDGLEAGDRFRLLFATSTTGQANHGDIAHYNTFVQNTAAAGHADIQAYSELFAVVGSTADTLSWPGATDARDNTATNYIDVDKGPPIYWLNGSKVADNYEDFYDGTWDDEDGAKDESGNDRSLSQASERPYTGSNNDGTGLALNALGASGFQVGLGHPGDDAIAGPLAGGGTSDGNSARPVYALSPVFEVGPEEFEFEVGARRTARPRDLLHVDGSKDLDRTVASAVQHSSAAQRVGLSATGPGRHQPSAPERHDHEPSSLIRTGSTLGGGSLKQHSRGIRGIFSLDDQEAMDDGTRYRRVGGVPPGRSRLRSAGRFDV